MFISISEMELGKVRLDTTFEPGAIEFFDEQLRQAGPLKLVGTSELIESTREIRVKGHMTVNIEAECDRCLEPTSFPVDTDFELSYLPDTASTPDDEIQIEDADSDIGFYEGEGLELGDVLREQILLSLPMQRVCKEGCKGICPVCGQNRNVVACDCHPVISDDRWSQLRNL